MQSRGGEMNEEELRNYIREEFVKPGFIEVYQWRNFIDYLQILIKKEITEEIRRKKQ